MSIGTGPDHVTRWVKKRLEKEVKARLDDFDFEKIARAGAKAIREKVLDALGGAVERGKARLLAGEGGVVEKAKDLVKKAEDEGKKLAGRLPKIPRWG